MSQTVYDENEGVLHIINDVRKLRGFSIMTVANEEELKAYQEGKNPNVNLSPVLAENEQEALEIVRKNAIPVNVSNYEFLKLQLKLIEDLANKENIDLITLDLFNVQDKPPVESSSQE